MYTKKDIQHTPILSISENDYETENVTVTVEWVQQMGVTYTISVSPLVPIIDTESVGHRLTIPYNTAYNLSVVAATPCRANATTIITLYYGELLHSCKMIIMLTFISFL